jgi:pimeloyl-ACP methyl ester carboxylesterase
MATFVLIHGSMHGAWCWRDLVPEIEGRGHSAIAPDLPCDDAEAGLVEYAAVVESLLPEASGDAELVLVGHSLGSRTVPVVAQKRFDTQMIFLCSAPTALGPVDPVELSDMVTPAYANAEFDERPDGARRVSAAMARPLFFHDCDEATGLWASQQLRWQGSKPLVEPSPLAAWPDRPMHMIVAQDDRVARADWLLAEASKWLSGGKPIVLPGGHSPMLSRPAALAEQLIECAVR